MVGQPHFTKELNIKRMADNFTGKTVHDSEGGLTNPAVDINRYVNLYNNAKLELDKIITDRYKLDDINLAIEKMKAGKLIGKCIIEMC